MMRSLCCLVPLATLSAMASQADGATTPAGELAKRIEMIRERFAQGDVPRFTRDFILADIELRPDYPRRFSEYSGDLSGRYIEALACLPDANGSPELSELVAETLRLQKPDGRFGDAKLVYTPDQIGTNHMALLWGNGRMLVALLRYCETHPEPEVLQAARKLGDFLVGVYDGCANKEVMERVRDLGAAGEICFSQLIEGLALLGPAAKEPKYLDAAARIVDWFPQERGKQHSHGYLTTLRGILLLHDATSDAKYLALVEDLYKGLMESPDALAYGGVMEYFGGRGDRDEGCSEADMLRLSLQLWRATGKPAYLEHAERCLFNQFYANQFDNGDFGHHLYIKQGVSPCVGAGRAWWCCTMHAMRAFRDVIDAITVIDDGVRIDLLLDAKAESADRATVIEQQWSAQAPRFAIDVRNAPADGVKIRVRRPAWVESVSATLNGQSADAVEDGGYLTWQHPFHQGDRIELAFVLRTEILLRDGTRISLDKLTEKPVEGILLHGPWILGADETDNPAFFGEPWLGNKVSIPASVSEASEAPTLFVAPFASIACSYTHDGFPGEHPLTLRPMSVQTAHAPAAFAAWLRYAK